MLPCLEDLPSFPFVDTRFSLQNEVANSSVAITPKAFQPFLVSTGTDVPIVSYEGVVPVDSQRGLFEQEFEMFQEGIHGFTLLH